MFKKKKTPENLLQQIYIQRNANKEFFRHQKGSPDGGREMKGGIKGHGKGKGVRK